MPGQLGNAAIAGHRTTYGQPFYRLDEVDPGDEIVVTTVQGRFVYRVTGSEIVGPTGPTSSPRPTRRRPADADDVPPAVHGGQPPDRVRRPRSPMPRRRAAAAGHRARRRPLPSTLPRRHRRRRRPTAGDPTPATSDDDLAPPRRPTSRRRAAARGDGGPRRRRDRRRLRPRLVQRRRRLRCRSRCGGSSCRRSRSAPTCSAGGPAQLGRRARRHRAVRRRPVLLLPERQPAAPRRPLTSPAGHRVRRERRPARGTPMARDTRMAVTAGEAGRALLEERTSALAGVVAAPGREAGRLDGLVGARRAAPTPRAPACARRSSAAPARRARGPRRARRRARRGGGRRRRRAARRRRTARRPSSIARAIGHPSSRAMRSTVQWSTTRPSRAAGMPKRLAGVATRRSQAMASCVPAPSAGPSTAAIVGIGSSMKPRSTAEQRRRELALLDAGEVGAGAERRRRAGQHERPAPSAASRWASSSPSNVAWSTALRRSGRSSVTTSTPVSRRRRRPTPPVPCARLYEHAARRPDPPPPGSGRPLDAARQPDRLPAPAARRRAVLRRPRGRLLGADGRGSSSPRSSPRACSWRRRSCSGTPSRRPSATTASAASELELPSGNHAVAPRPPPPAASSCSTSPSRSSPGPATTTRR